MTSQETPSRPLLVLLSVLALGAAAARAGAAPLVVVAAENFYGDVAQQIGGDKVAVTSIISDPGVNPHEYESRMDDAKAVAGADLVIENGAGYDPWMDALLTASPRPGRVVLKAIDVAPDPQPDNPHLWYSVDNVGALGDALTRILSRALPEEAAFFSRNGQTFRQSLVQMKRTFAIVTARWAGAPIGLTDTIFLYQTRNMGLRVLTPPELQQAVAEGNDPPVDAVVETEKQITDHRIRVLVVNGQTVSAVVSRLEGDAQASHIPIAVITETMPAGETYQTWMQKQLDAVQAALSGGAAP